MVILKLLLGKKVDIEIFLGGDYKVGSNSIEMLKCRLQLLLCMSQEQIQLLLIINSLL